MRRPFIPIMEGLDRRELQAVMTPLTVSPPNKSVPPFIPGPGLPTALEQARERFTATFSGRFNFGPPRFTGSYAYLFLQGTGTSSQFLHGNYSMGIVLPTQTGAAITGGAYLQDLNLSGGTEVGLDINFDPTSLDGAGRPTRGAWSVDPNIYSGPAFVAQRHRHSHNSLRREAGDHHLPGANVHERVHEPARERITRRAHSPLSARSSCALDSRPGSADNPPSSPPFLARSPHNKALLNGRRDPTRLRR